MAGALTVAQVAETLGVSTDTVRKLIQSGELLAFDVSTRRGKNKKHNEPRIDPDEVEAFKDRRRLGPKPKTKRPATGRGGRTDENIKKYY